MGLDKLNALQPAEHDPEHVIVCLVAKAESIFSEVISNLSKAV